nr:hypothetical protein [Tanacetum cinerariifolium]
VMAMPTILVPTEENLRDLIEIRVDIVHPTPVATIAFAATIVVRTLDSHGERDRERANCVETEGVTLRARVRSLEVVETWLHGIVKDEQKARERIEHQLGLVQEELESLRHSRLP